MKNNHFFRDAFGWGTLLWLFGYILSMISFMFIPVSLIGWVITPLAAFVTIWVLIKKINLASVSYNILIGMVWTLIAIVLDYFLIVKAFAPQDGYYKTDVYIYYALLLLLPSIVGLLNRKKAIAV